MHSFRQRAARGLQSGDSFSLSRCFTPQDIQRFAEISRDYNPVHYHLPFAEARGFREPVAHGLLTASLVTEIGGQIGWLASAMSFQFRRPVYAGDTVTCRWLITEVDARGRATAVITLSNEDGVIVLEGETRGVLPGEQERQLLSQMLAEGDPGNPLAL
ncbi:Acyl dehydratase [Pseudomonas sp. NFPP10]|uniref:MaoC family dehydratase n=1 Tax=unclassified Pseudomonas TaxID=196821 RepID=UPI00088D4155|nr:MULTISPECIES: MaoC family dehydratase [unclassified Pseudomonas]SDA14037.1 Acyl dehydratase [Pseudomonas sp. NFPP12]SEM50668.1 Acyl dehydratase [Pseudomonas sp. NFPP10]SFI11393.1 Acyl dehydratase [Pseudomonas sp. NFPP08]SFN43343.1 Acyl dehydratase [Pseudomonas sp. NFPP05]SFX99107.1 Acyl dehydratase [Pseudomonas sp. NFPP09]